MEVSSRILPFLYSLTNSYEVSEVSKKIFHLFYIVIAVNFTGMAISATAVYLSWDVPYVSGIVVQYFVVECDELETEEKWSFFAVETHAFIISLHPFYSYSCTIQVVGNETYLFNTPIIVSTHEAGNYINKSYYYY